MEGNLLVLRIESAKYASFCGTHRRLCANYVKSLSAIRHSEFDLGPWYSGRWQNLYHSFIPDLQDVGGWFAGLGL